MKIITYYLTYIEFNQFIYCHKFIDIVKNKNY